MALQENEGHSEEEQKLQAFRSCASLRMPQPAPTKSTTQMLHMKATQAVKKLSQAPL